MQKCAKNLFLAKFSQVLEVSLSSKSKVAPFLKAGCLQVSVVWFWRLSLQRASMELLKNIWFGLEDGWLEAEGGAGYDVDTSKSAQFLFHLNRLRLLCPKPFHSICLQAFVWPIINTLIFKMSNQSKHHLVDEFSILNICGLSHSQIAIREWKVNHRSGFLGSIKSNCKILGAFYEKWDSNIIG